MIDAHQHFWSPAKFTYPWMDPNDEVLHRDFLPSDLETAMRETGVERTVLVQANHLLDETRWFLDLADENEFIGGVVGWVDLCSHELDATLDELSSRRKLVGIRHITHDEPDDDWQVREDVLRGLAVLERRGYTYDLLFRPKHLRHVPTLARRFPTLRFVIDHIAKPLIAEGTLGTWLDEIRAAAAFENVYCKLSGMITEADWRAWTPDDLRPFVEPVVEAFTPRRLMFGSDWPVCLLAGSYTDVHAALAECLSSLSDSERSTIYGGTAAEFYRLDRSK